MATVLSSRGKPHTDASRSARLCHQLVPTQKSHFIALLGGGKPKSPHYFDKQNHQMTSIEVHLVVLSVRVVKMYMLSGETVGFTTNRLRSHYHYPRSSNDI